MNDHALGAHDALVTVATAELEARIALLFTAAGLPGGAARSLAEALVDADRDGVSSHGVFQVAMYVTRLRRGSVSTEEKADLMVDRHAIAVLDAKHMFGHLAADQAMALAVERAGRFGAGVVAVRRGFHFGVAGRYALAAARAGCVGIAMCNTRPLMPAPGGAQRLVGNNPIAIALPTATEPPLVLDMAMSEAALAKIRVALDAGTPIPSTWALAADGAPTTDPASALAGMLLPAAGAKGFGLALMIDLMCGLLSGGAWGDGVKPLYGNPAEPYDCAHLFIAVDVAHFRPLTGFAADAAAAVDRVRSSARMPGVDRISAPGERKWEQRRRNADSVRLPKSVLDTLDRLAADLGVSP
jgi:LDH2 family malate/lactate/ureidoglycolate dehydrogenase